MKLLNGIKGMGRRARINKDFERLCQKMLDSSSLEGALSVGLDNEFYSHFGMSVEDISAQLHSQKSMA